MWPAGSLKDMYGVCRLRTCRLNQQCMAICAWELGFVVGTTVKCMFCERKCHLPNGIPLNSVLAFELPLTGMTMIMQESSLKDAVQHAAMLVNRWTLPNPSEQVLMWVSTSCLSPLHFSGGWAGGWPVVQLALGPTGPN